MDIRVATWNLQWCSSRAWRKAPAQQRRIEQVVADVWVFTETFLSRSPGPGFTGVFSPPHLDRHPNPDERWTAVWSLSRLQLAEHRPSVHLAPVDAQLRLAE